MIIIDGLRLHSSRTCPFEMYSFIQKVKKKGYKLPQKIEFKDTTSWGFGWYDGKKIQISSNLESELAKTVLLHELLHCWGLRKHDEEFWGTLVGLCEELDVYAGIYFKHPDAYASAKRFWEKLKKGEVKCLSPKQTMRKHAMMKSKNNLKSSCNKKQTVKKEKK